MSVRALTLSLLLASPGCIAEDHEPPAPAAPGDVEPDPDDWAPDPTSPTWAGEPVPDAPERGPIGRGEPRRLSPLTGVELQAAIDLTAQELGADHDDFTRAELLMRQAELLLARDEPGDRTQALKTLRRLLDPRYAHYRRRDDALFHLAFELRRDGDADAFKQAALELVRTHPSSRWIPEVYVAFGDFYADAGKPEFAVRFYEKVVSGYPDTPVVVYALYRWAWCELDREDATRSLDRFMRAIDRGLARDDADTWRFVRAARADLPLAYARAGRPERAWNFFARVGRGPDADRHVADMARALVIAYQDLGRGDAAATVCRDLVQHAGPTPECADD